MTYSRNAIAGRQNFSALWRKLRRWQSPTFDGTLGIILARTIIAPLFGREAGNVFSLSFPPSECTAFGNHTERLPQLPYVFEALFVIVQNIDLLLRIQNTDVPFRCAGEDDKTGAFDAQIALAQIDSMDASDRLALLR